MADPPAPPPPGWYADPAHQHGSRWWDGSRWTDHVRDLLPNDDPPPAPVAAGGPPLSLSGRNRRVGVAVFALLVVGLVAVTAIGLGAVGGIRGDVNEDAPAALDPAEVEQRRQAAGCTTVVDGEPLEDRRHLDPAEAPPAAALYPDRPAHSGRHHAEPLPVPRGMAAAPIDERSVVHNMEHGSVVVWFDPAVVGDDERGALGEWRDRRAELGYRSRAGGAVFASPMPPDLDAPPAVAFRAWGVAMDCDRFDPLVADAFLIEHWGTHGEAPEAELSPYPDDALRLRDRA